jgi:hypothetical protein
MPPSAAAYSHLQVTGAADADRGALAVQSAVAAPLSRYPGGAWCAACKAVFDPDLELDGSISDADTVDALLKDLGWKLTDGRSVRFKYPLPDRTKADSRCA